MPTTLGRPKPGRRTRGREERRRPDSTEEDRGFALDVCEDIDVLVAVQGPAVDALVDAGGDFSSILMQAAVAQRFFDRDPDLVREALAKIQEAARDAILRLERHHNAMRDVLDPSPVTKHHSP